MGWYEFETFVSNHSAKLIMVMFVLIVISLIVASVGLMYVMRLMPLNALADATAAATALAVASGVQTNMTNRRNMQRYSSSDPSYQSVSDLQNIALTSGGSIGGQDMPNCAGPIGSSSDKLWTQLNTSLVNGAGEDSFLGLIGSTYESSGTAADNVVYAAPSTTGTLSNVSSAFTNRRR